MDLKRKITENAISQPSYPCATCNPTYTVKLTCRKTIFAENATTQKDTATNASLSLL